MASQLKLKSIPSISYRARRHNVSVKCNKKDDKNISVESAGKNVLLELQNAKNTRMSISTTIELTRSDQDKIKPEDEVFVSAQKYLGPWNWGFNFENGVQGRGDAHLTIYNDGAYNFSGYFRDFGIPSYDMGIVWAVKSSTNTVFLFTHEAHLAGTFERGSRNNYWNKSGVNDGIRNEWNNLNAGWSYTIRADANISLGSIVDAVKDAIGIIGAVVVIVA